MRNGVLGLLGSAGDWGEGSIALTACQVLGWCGTPTSDIAQVTETKQSVYAKENWDGKGFNPKGTCFSQKQCFHANHFFGSTLRKHNPHSPLGRRGRGTLYLVYPQQEWNSKCPKNLFVEMCHRDEHLVFFIYIYLVQRNFLDQDRKWWLQSVKTSPQTNLSNWKHNWCPVTDAEQVYLKRIRTTVLFGRLSTRVIHPWHDSSSVVPPQRILSWRPQMALLTWHFLAAVVVADSTITDLLSPQYSLHWKLFFKFKFKKNLWGKLRDLNDDVKKNDILSTKIWLKERKLTGK